MVKKFNFLAEVLGDLDELNSSLGLVRAFTRDKNLKQQILKIQDDLIEIGGFLAKVKEVNLKEKNISLEKKIKSLRDLRVKSFSRPGKNKTSSFLHFSRALCRRLERKISKLKSGEKESLISYFNFLSKLLFWLAKKEER